MRLEEAAAKRTETIGEKNPREQTDAMKTFSLIITIAVFALTALMIVPDIGDNLAFKKDAAEMQQLRERRDRPAGFYTRARWNQPADGQGTRQ